MYLCDLNPYFMLRQAQRDTGSKLQNRLPLRH